MRFQVDGSIDLHHRRAILTFDLLDLRQGNGRVAVLQLVLIRTHSVSVSKMAGVFLVQLEVLVKVVVVGGIYTRELVQVQIIRRGWHQTIRARCHVVVEAVTVQPVRRRVVVVVEETQRILVNISLTIRVAVVEITVSVGIVDARLVVQRPSHNEFVRVMMIASIRCAVADVTDDAVRVLLVGHRAEIINIVHAYPPDE